MRNEYNFYADIGRETIEFPVNPKEYTVSYPTDHKTYNVPAPKGAFVFNLAVRYLLLHKFIFPHRSAFSLLLSTQHRHRSPSLTSLMFFLFFYLFLFPFLTSFAILFLSDRCYDITSGLYEKYIFLCE